MENSNVGKQKIASYLNVLLNGDRAASRYNIMNMFLLVH